MHNAVFSSRSREVTPGLWMPPWGECPRRLGGLILPDLHDDGDVGRVEAEETILALMQAVRQIE